VDVTKRGRVDCALFLCHSALCMDRSRQESVRHEQPKGQANYVKRDKCTGEGVGGAKCEEKGECKLTRRIVGRQ